MLKFILGLIRYTGIAVGVTVAGATTLLIATKPTEDSMYDWIGEKFGSGILGYGAGKAAKISGKFTCKDFVIVRVGHCTDGKGKMFIGALNNWFEIKSSSV